MADREVPVVSLAAAAAALDRGEFTAAELTALLLERIERHNPRLRALSDVTARTARREASKADRQRAGGKVMSPLAGVPIAIKELIDTTPAVCSAGLPFLTDYRPDRDAKVVRQLRRAGAVIIGVTTSDPGAFDVRTPAVTHPQVPDRIVGGSSGGSGAALAAGLAFAALGSDTGGSIRIPAACCAVTGLKPTRARVSLEGVRPLVWSLDHVGPMTRSVADLALVQSILDPRYRTTRPRTTRQAPRIGHDPSYYQDADPDVKSGIAAALAACAALGAKVVEVSLPKPDAVIEIHVIIFCAESAAYHEATFADKWDLYPPTVRSFLDHAKQNTGTEYVTAMRTREAFTGRVDALFDDVDFLLLPTLPVTTPARDTETITLSGKDHGFTLAMVRYTCLFDHTGHPVVAMPVEVVAPGVAVSAQLVGPRNRDAATVDFAGRLEATLRLPIDYRIRE